MDNLNWLKRKYPESYKHIFHFAECDELKICKVGILTKDISTQSNIMYPKGTFVLFKRSSIHDYNHPTTYIIVKCIPGLTASGFHSFSQWEDAILEIIK